ncbi:hypothetical protein MK805_01180 [Shimazuella sp. AN120528]|uniref:hypothetical protein n=1 Tax=Shimazuella soli TaxID=1892854 RepID=UPI001F11793A|nr:hypothetical protein [Shimazuella soli]MCH5583583.1 hypothetical protein [Shimazuella soli]
MLFRKLISTSFLYILYIVITSVISISTYQGEYDNENHLGLEIWCIIALPIILIWSLLSVGIDRLVKEKYQNTVSFFIHFALGIILAISLNYAFVLSITLFNTRTVLVLVGVTLSWIIDRFIPSFLVSKEAKDFYIHKLWISAAVSIATVIYYFFQYPYFEFNFMNGISELPMTLPLLLTLIAPLSWIIDFQIKKIRASHWISLIFHLLLGLVYAFLDYFVSHSMELFILIMGQVLLFWIFTRIIPAKMLNISSVRGKELNN